MISLQPDYTRTTVGEKIMSQFVLLISGLMLLLFAQFNLLCHALQWDQVQPRDKSPRSRSNTLWFLPCVVNFWKMQNRGQQFVKQNLWNNGLAEKKVAGLVCPWIYLGRTERDSDGSARTRIYKAPSHRSGDDTTSILCYHPYTLPLAFKRKMFIRNFKAI